MNRDQILDTFRDLAKSQGFYGRLLANIDLLDEETRDAFFPTSKVRTSPMRLTSLCTSKANAPNR